MKAVHAVLAAAAGCIACVDAQKHQIWVTIVDGQCSTVRDEPAVWHATATWEDAIDTTGWGQLAVLGNDEGTGPDVAYAAGCAEGLLTWERMWEYWYNYRMNSYSGGQPCDALTEFMEEQMNWTQDQINANPHDNYWQSIGLLMTQFHGLVDGYKSHAFSEKDLSPLEIYMLGSVGDLEDLNMLCKEDHAGEDGQGLRGSTRVEGVSPTPEADKLLDCSAMIKVLPGNTDIVAGHTTWRDYYAMLRIYKVYTLPYTVTKTVSMSSSPGFLHSKDDFYATPTTIVMETTNSVFNSTLYHLYTVPGTLMSWQRAMTATQYTATGPAWTQWFTRHNSGTYNNQWMVVDLNLFVPGQALPSRDLLWIAEQIPGTVTRQDVTHVLAEKSYWPSFNIPYNKTIYDLSGYPAQAAKHGADFIYDEAPRYRIMARNESDVTSISTLQSLMRYNNWEYDPISDHDPILGSISSRGDLTPAPGAPTPFGGVDSKVVGYSMITRQEEGRGSDNIQVFAQSGPTHDQQPVFSFDDPEWNNIVREGLPGTWNFDWVTVDSNNL